MILLHNTDGLILNKNAVIEKTQQNFVNFLHKYLKSYLSEKNAYSQLHKALMFVHDTKRIDELSHQRLQLDIWLNKQLNTEMVFCYQNCSDLMWEKIVPVIEKTFCEFSAD